MSNYSKWTTSVVNSGNEAIVLHVISTAATRITLSAINSKVPDQSNNGINGSFYNFGPTNAGDLLSISVQNDYLVKPGLDGWYGGRYNIGNQYTNIPKGTLVYDGNYGSASVQRVSQYTDVAVDKRYNYWAQGGISMSLNDDTHWASIATSEDMPSQNTEVARTALAYTNGSSTIIYGIVTQTWCTAEKFRTAIKSTFSFGGAIFLDSGPSSQMRAVDSSGNVVKLTGGNTPQEMVVFG